MNEEQVTETVMRMRTINFEGNILPPSWLKHIKTDSGKPDSIGAILLSDIVYWYRPTEIRDEQTGQVIGYKKKFHADKLQRSYEQFADLYGYSKNQVRRSLKRLEEQGLITLELRNVTTKTGLVLSNVLFIEPVPEKIHEITLKVGLSRTLYTPMDKNVDTLPTNLYTPMDKNVDTYTEITTEITTESNTLCTPSDIQPLSTEEKEALNLLRNVANYPFDYEKDLNHIRTLLLDFPDIDFAGELKKWTTWLLDKPLKKRSNPRLQIRNWMANATKFQKQDEARGPRHGISDGKGTGKWASVYD